MPSKSGLTEDEKLTLREFLDSAMDGQDLVVENLKRQGKKVKDTAVRAGRVLGIEASKAMYKLEQAPSPSEFLESALKGQDLVIDNVKRQIDNVKNNRATPQEVQLIQDNAISAGVPNNDGWEDVPADDGWEDVPADDGWEDIPEVSPRQSVSQAELDQAIYDQSGPLDKIQLGANESIQELGVGTSDFLSGGGSNYYQTQLPDEAGRNQSIDLAERYTPGARDELARSRDVDGTLKTIGNIGGDIATLAIPGARIARGAGGLSKALAAEALLVGGYEGAKLPTQGTTRAGNAATGAIATAATGAVLPAVAAAGRKFIPIDEVAKPLLDRGVRLTPGEVTRREPVQMAEAALSRTPIIAGKIAKLKGQAREDMRALYDSEDWEGMSKLLKYLESKGTNLVKAGKEGDRTYRQLLPEGREFISGGKAPAGLFDEAQTAVQKVIGSSTGTSVGTVAGAIAAPGTTAATWAGRGAVTSPTVRDLMTGREGAGGLTKAIRAMYGQGGASATGVAGGTLLERMTEEQRARMPVTNPKMDEEILRTQMRARMLMEQNGW